MGCLHSRHSRPDRKYKHNHNHKHKHNPHRPNSACTAAPYPTSPHHASRSLGRDSRHPTMPLDWFVAEWTDKGMHVRDDAAVFVADKPNNRNHNNRNNRNHNKHNNCNRNENSNRGTKLNDFVALLLSPEKSPMHRYLYTRAHERLHTKTEFGMNCWQFVLVYLHTCHGLALHEIDAMYRKMPAHTTIPAFFTAGPAVSCPISPGVVACYTNARTGDIWHTGIVVSAPVGTNPEYTTLSISPGSGCVDASPDRPAGDIFYLSPADIVSAIRANTRVCWQLSGQDAAIDNVRRHVADGTAYRAIIRTDTRLTRELAAAKDACEQTLAPGDIADVDVSALPRRYVPSQRREYAAHLLCKAKSAELSKQIVDAYIAQCMRAHVPTSPAADTYS